MIVEGVGLTAAAVVGAARSTPSVSVSADAIERARRSFDFAAQQAQQRPVYGRSTGVGANKTVIIADPDGQALRLLRSHATSAGPLRADERIRAMLIVRLNQLSAGGSGADPSILGALAAMVTADALPPVREWGGIGTADLSALAVTALCLQGEVAGSRPVSEPAHFAISDALPFISSNAATIGDASLALVDLRSTALSALAVAALTFHAVDGNGEAFSPPVFSVSPFPGVRQVGELMGPLIAGVTPARIQDPFGLRTLPQVHGAFLDSLASLDACVTPLINAPSENPVFLPAVGLAHHGGFHSAYLGQALDAVVLAAAQAAQLSLARLAMLTEPSFTGLAPFLADDLAGSSGVMVAEYVAAAALGSLRALAQPTGLQTATISRGVEDDASFASLAARQALDAVAAYRTIVACELVAAVRCLRMRSLFPAPVVSLLRLTSGLDSGVADRDLTADIALATSVLPDFSAQMDAG
ncbi:MAG: aromatic amino acid lyase [Pseudonocardiales bacterium]|nr:aromatic amino acid lyase [Pseudonocardiales bacterium]